jgi:hypothetical protein
VESTLGALLDRQAARLVGRDRERAVLQRLVRRDAPAAVFVHGLAGVGKSTLVGRSLRTRVSRAPPLLLWTGARSSRPKEGFSTCSP